MFVYVCVYMHICIQVPMKEGQVWDPLQLELQVVVIHC